MSFSRRQQPEFRVLLQAAWEKAAPTLDDASRCKGKRCGACGFCQWYRAQMIDATGHESSSACNGGRDYDRAMARFEAIAGTGMKWQLKLVTGDARRIVHELDGIMEKHGIDQRYLQTIARKMTGIEHVQLEHLDRDQLILILGEVKRFVRRKKEREEAEIDVPF